MSSPETKKEPSPTLRSLPDDLLLNCLARVSRFHYPTLSLVSKSFRSLLASPELYKFRSLLNRTESCLYVCIQYSRDEYRWFTLCRKPNQTLTNDKKKPSGYVLVTIPNPPHTNVRGLVSVGSSIYNIDPNQSSSVWILDSRSHMWHKGPSLTVELKRFCASALDEKIYVAGCYKGGDDSGSLKNWFEVFDTKTQIWDPKKPHCCKDGSYFKSKFIDGKFHLDSGAEVVCYDPKEGKWNVVEGRMSTDMIFAACCVVNDILYSVNLSGEDVSECFEWYDTEVREWKTLKGLVGLPKFPRDSSCRLGDYGGKMAVLWEGNLPPFVGDRKMVWCAVIALERRENGEIWGKVEWSDHMLTLQNIYGVVKVLATTV